MPAKLYTRFVSSVALALVILAIAGVTASAGSPTITPVTGLFVGSSSPTGFQVWPTKLVQCYWIEARDNNNRVIASIPCDNSLQIQPGYDKPGGIRGWVNMTGAVDSRQPPLGREVFFLQNIPPKGYYTNGWELIVGGSYVAGNITPTSYWIVYGKVSLTAVKSASNAKSAMLKWNDAGGVGDFPQLSVDSAQGMDAEMVWPPCRGKGCNKNQLPGTTSDTE